MIDFKQFDSLISMTNYFNSEGVCKQAIVETRWGVGDEQDVVCPYCGGHHCATRKDGKFRCNHCKRNFSCKVGTIFEDTNLSLQKWFIAMYLISSHKKGIFLVSLHVTSRLLRRLLGICCIRCVLCLSIELTSCTLALVIL